jgi:hypothetical protein
MTKKERRNKKRIQIQNRQLVKKYPWLKPRNVWTDKTPSDYDYTYTELDAMEDGWRKTLGMMMIEEIDRELKQYHRRDNYRIMQIKEKYGMLRWYDFGAPKSVHRIIDKYSHISACVCGKCGKLDTPTINTGWIYPMCFDCYYKVCRHRGVKRNKAEIEEEYKKITISDDCTIPTSYTVRHFSNDGDLDETIDISETVSKIRKSQQRREKPRI